LLPSYVETQALALESLASPPLQILSQGYPGVKAFIDDEALIRRCLPNVFEFGGGSLGL
jgi:hypothetical protein